MEKQISSKHLAYCNCGFDPDSDRDRNTRMLSLEIRVKRKMPVGVSPDDEATISNKEIPALVMPV